MEFVDVEVEVLTFRFRPAGARHAGDDAMTTRGGVPAACSALVHATYGGGPASAIPKRVPIIVTFLELTDPAEIKPPERPPTLAYELEQTRPWARIQD